MKNTFAKMFTVCALAGVLGAAFIGCGDDGSSSPKGTGLPAEVADKAELETYECGMDVIGEKVYVADLELNYECDGEKWFKSYDQTKPSSTSTKSSSSKKSDGSSDSKTADRDGSSSSGVNKFLQNLDSSKSVWDYLNPDIDYGEFTDKRDGKIYKTVVIGGHVWMAENLNYAYKEPTETLDSLSLCYENNPVNCTYFGRLYLWSAAMDSAGVASGIASQCSEGVECAASFPIQGVCPESWHLPRYNEWESMLNYVDYSVSGIKLKTIGGWDASNDSHPLTNENSFGFSILPGGMNYHKKYQSVGTGAYFWTSTGRHIHVMRSDSSMGSSLLDRGAYMSVRCVMDSADGWSWNVPKKDRLNPKLTYGTMTDSRDNQTYKTIEIGNQVWMAENLNFDDESGKSFCYDDNPDYCAVTGRLYTWAAAIDSSTLANDESNPQICGIGHICDRLTQENLDKKAIQGICPSGWHLPSSTEWRTLITEAGGENLAARTLKSSSGWNTDSYGYGDGTDEKGFSALPAGDRNRKAEFTDAGSSTVFWSSSEGEWNDYYNYAACFGFHAGNKVTSIYDFKNIARSVRCIKDSE